MTVTRVSPHQDPLAKHLPEALFNSSRGLLLPRISLPREFPYSDAVILSEDTAIPRSILSVLSETAATTDLVNLHLQFNKQNFLDSWSQ